LLVHIGDPSSNQATTLESQVIHMIQELFGQTLRLSVEQKMAAKISGISEVSYAEQLLKLREEKSQGRYGGDP
jgi:hypothetical protein